MASATKTGNLPLLRQLPSVDSLLQATEGKEMRRQFGPDLTVEALRGALQDSRLALHRDQIQQAPTNESLIEMARQWLDRMFAPTLRPVINATGVIVHTNLGRAPLSDDSLAMARDIGAGYSTLEYDSQMGQRGSRAVHAEQLLKRLTGAEAALVVNNNAAAVLLMLTALCHGGEVIISRGQLVEIGGGFRVPDVMKQSGAKLVEIGTTNRTHIRDYSAAIGENTSAVLVAHHSNYKIVGFAGEPSLEDLGAFLRDRDIPFLYDQGSGLLLDVAPFGLDPEPTVSESLAAGVDVVAFSGDKLLGGPQAGILCGRRSLIERIKRHPLARAVRADKLCLSALTITLSHYLKGHALQEIPVWQMISRSLEEIELRASDWSRQLADDGWRASVIDGNSTVGGGSLPGTTLPTKLLAINIDNAEDLAAELRRAPVPVIGRIQNDRFLCDPRTVLPGQGRTLIDTILALKRST